MSLQPLKHDLIVEVPVERAFELFVERLGDWWPIAYTFSGADFETAQIDPRAGGRWFERTGQGEEIPWGHVRAYERGQRVVLQWGIGIDRKPARPERSSEVEFQFAADGETRTRISVEHRDFERHGEGAEALRQGMGSAAQGWPLILAEFRRAARRSKHRP
jgi:uncharacterized protein YndB with AHSA1/START domain